MSLLELPQEEWLLVDVELARLFKHHLLRYKSGGGKSGFRVAAAQEAKATIPRLADVSEKAIGGRIDRLKRCNKVYWRLINEKFFSPDRSLQEQWLELERDGGGHPLLALEERGFVAGSGRVGVGGVFCFHDHSLFHIFGDPSKAENTKFRSASAAAEAEAAEIARRGLRHFPPRRLLPPPGAAAVAPEKTSIRSSPVYRLSDSLPEARVLQREREEVVQEASVRAAGSAGTRVTRGPFSWVLQANGEVACVSGECKSAHDRTFTVREASVANHAKKYHGGNPAFDESFFEAVEPHMPMKMGIPPRSYPQVPMEGVEIFFPCYKCLHVSSGTLCTFVSRSLPGVTKHLRTNHQLKGTKDQLWQEVAAQPTRGDTTVRTRQLVWVKADGTVIAAHLPSYEQPSASVVEPTEAFTGQRWTPKPVSLSGRKRKHSETDRASLIAVSSLSPVTYKGSIVGQVADLPSVTHWVEDSIKKAKKAPVGLLANLSVFIGRLESVDVDAAVGSLAKFLEYMREAHEFAVPAGEASPDVIQKALFVAATAEHEKVSDNVYCLFAMALAHGEVSASSPAEGKVPTEQLRVICSSTSLLLGLATARNAVDMSVTRLPSAILQLFVCLRGLPMKGSSIVQLRDSKAKLRKLS